MCGIAGILNLAVGRTDPQALRRMVGALRHRGPDAIGFHEDAGVALGHARLSIIDLARGQQPMHNEDRSIWITFNGEIFNYRELREDLEQRGHRFATQSDTETILHLYEEKGEACVEDLNGQWAFAIWDAPRRKLFLSRDRLGVRPLFYTRAGGDFLFASEIKALFTNPAVRRQLDPHALAQLFTFWVTLPPRTSFQDISELPPGHSMTVSDAGVRIDSYWQADYQPDEALPDEAACAEALLERLRHATRLRLRADVPTAAYLSGGLDSTLIAALAAQEAGTTLQTFSIAFDDPEFDESSYQQDAARQLGTRHTELRCADADIGRIFPEVVRHTEKPVLRTAPAPMYLLAKSVHDAGCKVVLTGEGADEMFGGYDIFKEAKIRRFCAQSPRSSSRPQLLARLYPYLPALRKQSRAYLQAFFRVRDDDLRNPFFSHLPRWDMSAQLCMLFSKAMKSELRGYDVLGDLAAQLPPRYGRWDHFAQAQYLESALLLPGYILSSQGDRMAMAHAVEARFPFLDPGVVAYAARLPARLKMKVLNEKYLLKRAARGLVPPRIVRRAKQPYRAPDLRSFMRAPVPDYVARVMAPERIRRDGIFDAEAVVRLMHKARRGDALGTRDNMAFVGVLSTGLLIEQMT